MSESRKDEKNVKKTEELRERLSDEEYERRRQIRKFINRKHKPFPASG